MSFILDDTRSLRDSPPRNLNLFTQIQVMFGGFAVQFGALFFWFGMVFAIIFIGQSELVYLFSNDGEWVNTTGVVQRIEPSGVTVNNEPYYKFSFSFDANGQNLQGTCNGPRGTFSEEQVVPIEYTSLNTDRARIIGMTTKNFPAFVAFVLIFPLIGLLFMIGGFFSNYKALTLLRNGLFTKGKKLSATPTNTRINKRTVYAYEFTFEVAHKPYIAKCKTHLKERVEDEELEKILYDEKDPSISLVYDSMGAAPAIDQFGKIVQSGPLALRFLLSTLIGLVVNGFIVFFILL